MSAVEAAAPPPRPPLPTFPAMTKEKKKSFEGKKTGFSMDLESVDFGKCDQNFSSCHFRGVGLIMNLLILRSFHFHERICSVVLDKSCSSAFRSGACLFLLEYCIM